MALPPTRIISFQQQVEECDPDWQKDKLRPWIYEFSNGKLFYWRPDIHTTPGP